MCTVRSWRIVRIAADLAFAMVGSVPEASWPDQCRPRSSGPSRSVRWRVTCHSYSLALLFHGVPVACCSRTPPWKSAGWPSWLRDQHAHPGAVTVAGDRGVEGEFQYPDLAELPYQVARELLHPRQVGVHERLQGPLVVLGTVRFGDYPDPQVPRLDFRVVAVLQQHDPAHRAGETCLDLAIDLAFDRIQHIPARPGLPR
jgi:hypothetical protein